MISSFQTGHAAGSQYGDAHPGLSLMQMKTAAEQELAVRKRFGVAHIYPEQDFLSGFVSGCSSVEPSQKTFRDGLVWYVYCSPSKSK